MTATPGSSEGEGMAEDGAWEKKKDRSALFSSRKEEDRFPGSRKFLSYHFHSFLRDKTFIPIHLVHLE